MRFVYHELDWGEKPDGDEGAPIRLVRAQLVRTNPHGIGAVEVQRTEGVAAVSVDGHKELGIGCRREGIREIRFVRRPAAEYAWGSGHGEFDGRSGELRRANNDAAAARRGGFYRLRHGNPVGHIAGVVGKTLRTPVAEAEGARCGKERGAIGRDAEVTEQIAGLQPGMQDIVVRHVECEDIFALDDGTGGDTHKRERGIDPPAFARAKTPTVEVDDKVARAFQRQVAGYGHCRSGAEAILKVNASRWQTRGSLRLKTIGPCGGMGGIGDAADPRLLLPVTARAGAEVRAKRVVGIEDEAGWLFHVVEGKARRMVEHKDIGLGKRNRNGAGSGADNGHWRSFRRDGRNCGKGCGAYEEEARAEAHERRGKAVLAIGVCGGDRVEVAGVGVQFVDMASGWRAKGDGGALKFKCALTDTWRVHDMLCVGELAADIADEERRKRGRFVYEAQRGANRVSILLDADAANQRRRCRRNGGGAGKTMKARVYARGRTTGFPVDERGRIAPAKDSAAGLCEGLEEMQRG